MSSMCMSDFNLIVIVLSIITCQCCSLNRINSNICPLIDIIQYFIYGPSVTFITYTCLQLFYLIAYGVTFICNQYMDSLVLLSDT